MVKPLVGDIVVLPFPQTDLQAGKRRPALVVADLIGDDFILCQITSRSSRHDGYSVPLSSKDFDHGDLKQDSFIRANRLFTVDPSVVIYIAARVTDSKVKVVRDKIRELFD